MPWLTHVAQAFALPPLTPTGLSARGLLNVDGVVQVRTSDSGALLAVKRSTERPRQAALDIEAAARAEGLPVPRALSTPQGPTVASGPSGEWYRVFDWVPGSRTAVSARARWGLAALLARLHRVPVPERALRLAPWQPPDAARWERLGEKALALSLPWAPSYAVRLPVVRDWLRRLAEAPAARRSVPSHRDLHPANVLSDVEGRLWLVDWDAAGPATPDADAVCAALLWSQWHAGGLETDDALEFLVAFHAAGGPRVACDVSQYLRMRLWWLWHNAERDTSGRASPRPELTEAVVADVDESVAGGLDALGVAMRGRW